MKKKGSKNLTWTQRLQLEAYMKAKVPKRQIARNLGCCIATVYNELKRGVYDHTIGNTLEVVKRYSPDIAEEKYQTGLQRKGAPLKIGNDFEFADYVEQRIVEGISPYAVLGEIKNKKMQFRTQICTQTLYSYIRKGVFLRLSIENVTRTKKQRKQKVRAARPPKGTSIERRPLEIQERTKFGHWEMDCIIGKDKTTLLTLVERVTRRIVIFKMPNHKAESVVFCLNRLERQYGKMFSKVFKSITVDNGSEFADVVGMERSSYSRFRKRTKFYYCHPYSSWERGSNERLNREVRRLLPKGTNFSKFSPEQIKAVEDWVNQYPRGVLNFYTSQEAYERELQKLTA